jgi:hypothetical protein
MTPSRILATAFVLAATVLATSRAEATFHVMQIEQIIAGVDGSTATQAIQLRMRIANQTQVQNARLIAHDATGANPVLLIAFGSPVTVFAAGSHVLAATASFSSATNPALTPDFVLTNPIPDSYIPAGSLTFEDNFGTIYWRVSWGGAAYTGPTDGVLTNDSDGEFGVWPTALPKSTGQALLFQGATNAGSTTNQADYAETPGSAVFTKNSGASASIVSLVGVPAGASEGIALGNPIPNPVVGSMTYSVTLPREEDARVDLYDARGRRVANLVNAVLPAGRNGFTWDPYARGGEHMRTGVYFLALQAGGVKKTQRFILLGPGQPLHDGD